MKLKHAILQVVDRRSAKDMATGLSRAHRATPEFLLELLYVREVREVSRGS